MHDLEKVIKELSEMHGSKETMKIIEQAIFLLKKQEAKWHVFHENEDGVMEVECSPNNCEQILWYRKYSNDICVTTWDDDEWAEYACNADGENFEDGDAWMELPSKP